MAEEGQVVGVNPTADGAYVPFRPAGAVATSMVNVNPVSSVQVGNAARVDVQHETAAHTSDPYKLEAEVGATVTASYPFNGEKELKQMSFKVGDRIKVLEKEEMWSWGKKEKSGDEGWFPHNYVGSVFKPLPGMVEMALKAKERRERMEAAAAAKAAPEASGEDVATGVAGESVEVADGAEEGGGDTAAQGGGDMSDSLKEAVSSAPSVFQPESGVSSVVPPMPAVPPPVPSSSDQSAGSLEEAAGALASNLGTAQSPSIPGTEDVNNKETPLQGPPLPPMKATPALPPFSKGMQSMAGHGVGMEQGKAAEATKEVSSSVEEGQTMVVDGIGQAGATEGVSTGCKCLVM